MEEEGRGAAAAVVILRFVQRGEDKGLDKSKWVIVAIRVPDTISACGGVELLRCGGDGGSGGRDDESIEAWMWDVDRARRGEKISKRSWK